MIIYKRIVLSIFNDFEMCCQNQYSERLFLIYIAMAQF